MPQGQNPSGFNSQGSHAGRKGLQTHRGRQKDSRFDVEVNAVRLEALIVSAHGEKKGNQGEQEAGWSKRGRKLRRGTTQILCD